MDEVINIKTVNSSNNELPKFATIESACADLQADIINKESEDIKGEGIISRDEDGNKILIIPSMASALIPTGLRIAIPMGYRASIRPRSGLALKHSVTVCNSPGTIDSDYRGDIGVILINHGRQAFKIKHGDRIAQICIEKVEKFMFVETTFLDTTERGKGGFGSTGV